MKWITAVLTAFAFCWGISPVWSQEDGGSTGSESQEEVTPESFRTSILSDLARWQHATARKRLEEEKTAFGKSTGYTVAWAVMLAQERNFDKAIQQLTKAVRKDKSDPSAPYYLGEILSWQKLDTSVEAWQQARDRATALLEEDKKNGWALYWYGSALVRLQEFSKAEGQLKKALKKGANVAMTEFQLGLALMYQEKWEPARAAFSRCLEADSGFSHAYYFRGRVWKELDKTEEMLLDMDRFLNLAPDAREASAAKSILRAGG